ncbi:MAG: GNAT family N-acetyltransferase [Acidobacteriaceae bacterium]
MMSVIEIVPVKTSGDRRRFATFPWQIYQHDRLWVPPLLAERLRFIDPSKGVFFKRGSADFFMALKEGKLAGTICCAEDGETNAARGLQDCMIGFFECSQDPRVAQALFDHAKQWALSHHLDTLYGPFNLDYEDGYGVLVEGRDRPPVVLCGHTPPYYQAYFEQYGFLPARGDNIAYEITASSAALELKRLARLSERLRRRGWIRIRSGDLEHWDEEVDRVHGLLNKALMHLPDFIPWPREGLQAALAQFRKIVDPELVLFADVDGETVGWFPGIPNVNEALIHANGLRYPWDYLRLIPYIKQQPKCLAIKSVLVLPEYWDTGVAVLLFDEMARRAIPKGYTWFDLSLTSDDNPYTPTLATRAGARIYKRYRVYRLKL